MTNFDWITPLWAFVQDVINGSPAQINIPYDCGYSARQICDRLNYHGIKTWGVMVVGETITFTVRQSDLNFASIVLIRWRSNEQLHIDQPYYRLVATAISCSDVPMEDVIWISNQNLLSSACLMIFHMRIYFTTPHE